jgi:serine/threonine-protein phosphatase 2A regulatory subunit B'
MLRSLKASLKSGKKASSSPKEEAQAVTNKQTTSTAVKQAAPAASKQPTVKEKPGLPVINEESLRHYYAEPLPSFRDVSATDNDLCFQAALGP